MYGRLFAVTFLSAAGIIGVVLAQQGAPTPRPASPPKAAAPKPAPTPQPPPAAPSNLPIGLEQSLYLIRSTLLTLNDANRSGNYTVMRDLAAPSFQAKNSAADLALIFSDLRQRKFDLFAAALIAPQLAAAPAIETNGMLRLKGLFPTRPLQIDFDLAFENVGGQWRLFAISVATTETKPAAAPTAAKP